MNTPSLSDTLADARGILFDMDGVLIDSEPIHEKAIIALTAELGDALDDEAILYSFKGAPEKSMAARLLEMYPGQKRTAEEIIRRKIELFAEIFHHVTLVDGAMEFLAKSHAAGRRHGLTTSASRATQGQAFDTFGFGKYFDTIVTGEDITRGKPDPEPYLLTAERLGLETRDCIVIEDSINGVLSGKAAGCRVVAITGTFPVEQLLRAGADFIIHGFDELS
ncbi:HAD family phosphatase [Luteolibacter yonseiensis]|uniref:HAD family phosphatase n=1 Tax=Luteolibacter yonseiensis TaxID=1144680 RepID=A0A934R4J2_9BACT|nr:HAD family phosphatase [Luteolibacter yonseiensis]MBK1816136.1 HAD family phosphatase [Luteolibacter yonseiensis]